MYGVTNYFRLRFRLPYRVTNDFRLRFRFGNVMYFEVFINNIRKDYYNTLDSSTLKWMTSNLLGTQTQTLMAIRRQEYQLLDTL